MLLASSTPDFKSRTLAVTVFHFQSIPLGNLSQKPEACTDGSAWSSVSKGKAGTDPGVLCSWSLSSLPVGWTQLQMSHILATVLASCGKPLQLQVCFLFSWCFPDEPPLFCFLSLSFRKAFLALTLLRKFL